MKRQGPIPAARILFDATGLSPLVRGNLQFGHVGKPYSGPIPARRKRNGPIPARKSNKGLSPLVRGNRVDREVRMTVGPIPARAGKPRYTRSGGKGLSPLVRGNPQCRYARAYATSLVSSINRTRAYPRSCGETPSAFVQGRIVRRGLSPLVRGNPICAGGRLVGPIPARLAPDRSCVQCGPIPARAGKPTVTAIASALGLGPIPARAGKPLGLNLLILF